MNQIWKCLVVYTLLLSQRYKLPFNLNCQENGNVYKASQFKEKETLQKESFAKIATHFSLGETDRDFLTVTQSTIKPILIHDPVSIIKRERPYSVLDNPDGESAIMKSIQKNGRDYVVNRD